MRTATGRAGDVSTCWMRRPATGTKASLYSIAQRVKLITTRLRFDSVRRPHEDQVDHFIRQTRPQDMIVRNGKSQAVQSGSLHICRDGLFCYYGAAGLHSLIAHAHPVRPKKLIWRTLEYKGRRPLRHLGGVAISHNVRATTLLKQMFGRSRQEANIRRSDIESA